MTERIINKNAEQKISIKEEAGETVIERTEKIDSILEKNKIERNNFRANNLINNTQKHHRKVAEIPANLFFELQKKYGSPQQNWKEWKRWLSDPENRFFRTDTGKL